MAIFRDPKCVYVTDTFGDAQGLVTALDGEGIPAEVMDEMTRGGFEGLTALLPGSASIRGVEVWVVDLAHAERAREIVAIHEAALVARVDRTGEMVFNCDECGKQLVFPASEEGTVQVCTHCNAFVDVPDSAKLEPDDADYGEPEPEPTDE